MPLLHQDRFGLRHDGRAPLVKPGGVAIGLRNAVDQGSAKARPAICIASGRPAAVNPVGTEIAGVPVTLNGIRHWRS